MTTDDGYLSHDGTVHDTAHEARDHNLEPAHRIDLFVFQSVDEAESTVGGSQWVPSTDRRALFETLGRELVENWMEHDYEYLVWLDLEVPAEVWAAASPDAVSDWADTYGWDNQDTAVQRIVQTGRTYPGAEQRR